MIKCEKIIVDIITCYILYDNCCSNLILIIVYETIET